MTIAENRDFWVRCTTLLTPYERRADAAIRIHGGKIAEIVDAAALRHISHGDIIFEEGATVAPGFIDLHVHGASGRDLMDGTLESLQTVASTLVRYGTTSFLATTLSAPDGDTETALRGYAAHHRLVAEGARPLGIHMEGPYLNPVRRGTHNAGHVKEANPAAFRRFCELSGGCVRKVTIAPEMDPGLQLTKQAVALGIRVSIGHSDATEAQARAAIDAGASQATHMFNAMRPLHHREPGLIGAVLTDERVYAEVIADGVHVHPTVVRLIVQLKGIERTLLITDGLSALGMPDGSYPLGNQMVTVEDGVCRDHSGSLAGSTLTQDRAVRNVSEWMRLPAEKTVAAASAVPAQSMGMERIRGVVAPGADADLVFLDAEMQVVKTMVAGAIVYSR
jgi:N-acetylglucosamine-6-phosphate deacetylase